MMTKRTIMAKKMLLLLVLVICVAVVHDADAGVIPDNNTKLYWRDNFGAANDSYIEAARGDTVFVAVWVNNLFYGDMCNLARMTMWWDTDVLDDPTAEYLPYAHLKDYRIGDGVIPDGVPFEGFWQLEFRKNKQTNSSLYVYPLGSGDTGGVPLATTFDFVGTYGQDAGGRLLGFYIPISATAPVGETYFNFLIQGWSAFHGRYVWEEELSDTVNTDWGLRINVIPEPATMSLLAMGGLAVLRRRKK